ncbi:Integral membrane protein linked to a cation pump [Candidatus Terasakiella magnetica]|uniref:Integral membrane protein linked to a cation pump n=1 Tax=Candidatus Terasakiella magnetica TaxID=1867952 RepID=A0A1C3RGS5_9PROT|nr:FixH family protein [Candidatus Terasakiella magnetica]SCA56465.1 Integral membrane protein linked to a cation pump [Candidatus Terasakiella magnetica]
MSKQRAPGWWYPWIFVGFFAVIITVNGIMMFFAYDSWTGLETKDHYLKGLAYDNNVAGAKAQAALGWDVKIDVSPLESVDLQRKVAYQVTFLDHNKKPVKGLKAHIFFIRPTSEGLDVDEPVDMTGDGVVSGEIVLPVPGQWDTRVHAESLGRQYQLVERVVVR